MLTKNFYSVMLCLGARATVPLTLLTGEAITAPYASSTSNLSSWYGPFYGMRFHNPSPTGTATGVMFGTGCTKATVNDFALEAPITSGLTVANPSAITINRTPLYEEYVVTFGVTASTDVSIGEIGLVGNLYTTLTYADGSSTTTNAKYLADRTVLETPITIAAGESKQITYAIRFNYPAV